VSEILFYCYLLDRDLLPHVDEDQVWWFTERHGGHMSFRGSGVLFWVPQGASLLFDIAWPELRRQPLEDLWITPRQRRLHVVV